MKTKVITGLKKEVLVLQLPRVCDYELKESMIFIMDTEKSVIHRFKGSFTLLGKPDEIKEEDAMELVEQSIHSGLFAHYVKGIPVNTYCYKTALDSFHSALESEIYWNVNPLGEEPILEAICCGNLRSDAWGYPQCCGVPNATEESIELHSMWYEAQEKTFDRNRTLIFVKD